MDVHLANAYYGHAAILRRWAGAPSDRPIAGMLQHGWNTGTGFTPHDLPRAVRRFLPCFVWNEYNLRRSMADGYGAVAAVGAPFLYLARATPLTFPPRPSKRTIAYPFHAWEGETVRGGSHQAYARQIAEREGSATVCLYWLEYEDVSVRGAYEEQGHRTICHGRRTDPWFLDAQLAALRDHNRMVTNRVSSALWYASALGLEVEIYGPRMGFLSDAGLQSEYEGHRRRWPEFFEGPVSSDAATARALLELGAAFVREPAELAFILGFRGPRRAFATLAPLSRTFMRVKERLLGKDRGRT